MNMFKIAFAGTALVGSLATAVANNTCSFSGFYAGAQVGVGTTNTHLKTPVNFNLKSAATGFIGGAHIGYGKHFPNRFYFGFEAFGNFNSNKSKQEAIAYNLIIKRSNSFGLAFRPGMVFGNTLVNLILGIESANFKHTFKDLTNPADDISKSKRSYGFVPGLGVSFLANQNLVLGLEARHAMYKNTKPFKGVDDIKSKSQSTDVMAKVSYKF